MSAGRVQILAALAAATLAATPAAALEGRYQGSFNRTEGIADGDVMRHLYEIGGRRTLPRGLDARLRFSLQYGSRLGVAQSDVLRTRFFGDLRAATWRLDAQLEPWQRNAPGPALSRERQAQVGFHYTPRRLPSFDATFDRLDRDTAGGRSFSESKRLQAGWSGRGVTSQVAFRRVDTSPAGVITVPSRTNEWNASLNGTRGWRRGVVEGGYEALVSSFAMRARRRDLDTQRIHATGSWTPIPQVTVGASFLDRWGKTRDNALRSVQRLDEIATSANVRVRPLPDVELQATREYRRQSATTGRLVTDYVQMEGLFRRAVTRGLQLQTGYLGSMRIGAAPGEAPRSSVYGFLDGRLHRGVDGRAELRASRATGEGISGVQWRRLLQLRTHPTRGTRLEVGWRRDTLPEFFGVAQRDREWDVTGGWEPFRGASFVGAWRRLDGDGRVQRAERQRGFSGTLRTSERSTLSANWSRRASRTAAGGTVDEVLGLDFAFWLPGELQTRAHFRDGSGDSSSRRRSYGLSVEKRF